MRSGEYRLFQSFTASRFGRVLFSHRGRFVLISIPIIGLCVEAVTELSELIGLHWWEPLLALAGLGLIGFLHLVILEESGLEKMGQLFLICFLLASLFHSTLKWDGAIAFLVAVSAVFLLFALFALALALFSEEYNWWERILGDTRAFTAVRRQREAAATARERRREGRLLRDGLDFPVYAFTPRDCPAAIRFQLARESRRRGKVVSADVRTQGNAPLTATDWSVIVHSRKYASWLRHEVSLAAQDKVVAYEKYEKALELYEPDDDRVQLAGLELEHAVSEYFADYNKQLDEEQNSPPVQTAYIPVDGIEREFQIEPISASGRPDSWSGTTVFEDHEIRIISHGVETTQIELLTIDPAAARELESAPDEDRPPGT